MVSNVVVLGSANADLVVEVPRRPGGGETLLGSDLQLFAGGKGANQAAAAARGGATTRFLGCVGPDAHGEFLRRHLTDAGVDVSGVRTGSRPTGTALILLTPDGENWIVVSPGANAAVDVAMVEEMSPVWMSADVLILNLEVPLETVTHLVARAAAGGVRLLLNAAPAVHFDRAVLEACDPLSTRRRSCSAARRTRASTSSLRASSPPVPDPWSSRSAPRERSWATRPGSLSSPRTGSRRSTRRVPVTPSSARRPASSPAAQDLREAVRFATAMSAIAVQSKGAQSSYPDRDRVDEFLRDESESAAG